MTDDSAPKNLPVALLLLRLGVAVVMIAWTDDKLLNPSHAGAVFDNFYGLGGLGPTLLMLLGIGEAIIVLAFVTGTFRTISYGAVLAMHAVSTLSSWRQYLDPFENLLFFAAWPMLAACVALFMLRTHDRLFAIDEARLLRAG